MPLIWFKFDLTYDEDSSCYAFASISLSSSAEVLMSVMGYY